MPPELVKLMVAEVNLAVPAGPGVEAGMVVLAEVEEPRRRLQIIIAKAEARAIHGAWTGAVPTRPSTWDLYVSTVALLEARIDRVIITSVQEDRHFFATLEMDRSGELRVLACRPSDAIAIALRAYGADIYCRPEVVDRAGLNEDGSKFGPWTWPEEPADGPTDHVVAAGTVGQPPEGALPGSGPTVETIETPTGWDIPENLRPDPVILDKTPPAEESADAVPAAGTEEAAAVPAADETSVDETPPAGSAEETTAPAPSGPAVPTGKGEPSGLPRLARTSTPPPEPPPLPDLPRPPD